MGERHGRPTRVTPMRRVTRAPSQRCHDQLRPLQGVAKNGGDFDERHYCHLAAIGVGR
jgi:hypothetical protein